jgi:5-methylcytosine-specific restriction enzyme subunit McrC
MVHDLELVESRQSSLNISEDDASLLSRIGRELASTQRWWGKTQLPADRSVIDVRRAQDGRFEVTFREVIGVVQIGACRIHVRPKIPWEHFIFIASRSELAPRVSSEIASVEPGFEFLEILCRWFVEAAERLFTLGLRSDYLEVQEEREEIRGQLLPLQTAMEVMKGRPIASCVFDELSINTPFNRIIRATCERVARLEKVSAEVRRRSRRLVYRMDTVGALRSDDRRLKPDRLTKSYIRPLALAHLILDGCGVTLSIGHLQGTAFLIRTPQIIEDGMRSIVAEGLPSIQVRKRRLLLDDSGISINPDIVFGDSLAVADVKYKYFDRDWNRNDFNQIVTFATALHCDQCALLGFTFESSFSKPSIVSVGRVKATRIGWPVGLGAQPQKIADVVTAEFGHWLLGT